MTAIPLGEWISCRKRFLIKASVALVMIVSAFHYGSQRYSIAYDTNPLRCIADYSVFAVDWYDQELKRGALYVFASSGVEPIFEDGALITKYLLGLPGDTVRIDESQRVFVNGEQVGDTLRYADRLGMAAEDFIGEGVIPEDEYWFFGDTDTSFDSRYWGGVSKEQILGRAHGIF